MNRRKNEGITLIALVITIIVLLIIVAIPIANSEKGIKQSEEVTYISELTMIQHAILERYTSSIYTKQELPGIAIEKSKVELVIKEINEICNTNIELKGNEYKRLLKQDLKKLGIENEEDIYIVNYKTGEVINETKKTTESKKALYIYAKDEK